VSRRSYQHFHSVHLEAQVADPLNVIEVLEILAGFGRTAEGRHGDVGECDTLAAHFVKSLGQSLGRREKVDQTLIISLGFRFNKPNKGTQSKLVS
jgi:hypothetical protein